MPAVMFDRNGNLGRLGAPDVFDRSGAEYGEVCPHGRVEWPGDEDFSDRHCVLRNDVGRESDSPMRPSVSRGERWKLQSHKFSN